MLIFETVVLRFPGFHSHHLSSAFDVDMDAGDLGSGSDEDTMPESFGDDSSLSEFSARRSKNLTDGLPFTIHDIEMDENSAEGVKFVYF